MTNRMVSALTRLTGTQCLFCFLVGKSGIKPLNKQVSTIGMIRVFWMLKFT